MIVRHALRSALLPFVTLLGARIPELVTGAILVETVFSWPGVASASVQAALAADFPLLAALTLLATLAGGGAATCSPTALTWSPTRACASWG